MAKKKIKTQATANEASADIARPAAPEKPPAKKKAKKEKAKKVSALDAAARVLTEAGTPLNCQEMIDIMAQKGYWKSPGGKTPASTLYSAILREAKTRAKESRFRKTERGKFEINSKA